MRALGESGGRVSDQLAGLLPDGQRGALEEHLADIDTTGSCLAAAL